MEMGWKLDFIERLYALLHSGGLKMFRKAEILFFKVLYCVPLVVAAITPILLPLVIAGVIIFWFPMVGKAEMQPFYNFEVTVDRAEDDQFNEKIEVYVEKDGQYFDDYDFYENHKSLYSLFGYQILFLNNQTLESLKHMSQTDHH